MKLFAQKALFASLALAAPMVVGGGQAHAQARGVAVADLDAAVEQSTAYTNAMTAMQTTYKATFDQVNARQTALNAELAPLVTAFENARNQPNATEQSVQPSFTALQNKRNAANQELQRLSQPIALARAYVIEQIVSRMEPAVQAAMRSRNVDLLLAPSAVVTAQGNADITAAVVAEINRAVPSVQIVPPAGWQPGQAPAAPQQTQPQPQGR